MPDDWFLKPYLVPGGAVPIWAMWGCADYMDPQIFSKVIKFIVHVEKFIGDLETIVTRFSDEGEEKREEKRRNFLEKLRSIVHQEDMNNASLIALLQSNSSLQANDTATPLHRVLLLPKSLFNETLSFLKDEVNEIENVQKILQKAENKTQTRNHTKNSHTNEHKATKLSNHDAKLKSDKMDDKTPSAPGNEDAGHQKSNSSSEKESNGVHNDNEEKTFFVTQLNDQGKAAADGGFNLTSNGTKSEGEDAGMLSGLQDAGDEHLSLTPFNTSTDGEHQLNSTGSQSYNESMFMKELTDAEHALDELSHKANNDRAKYLKTYSHGSEGEKIRNVQGNTSAPLIQYGSDESKDDMDEDEEEQVQLKKNNTIPTEDTNAATRAKKSFEPTPKKIDVNIVLNVSTNTPSVMLNPILYNDQDLSRRIESPRPFGESDANETHIVLTTQKFKESLNDAILLFAHRLKLLNFTHGLEKHPAVRKNFSYWRDCERRLQCSYGDTHNARAPGHKTNVSALHATPVTRETNKTVANNTESNTRHIYKYQSPRLHGINSTNKNDSVKEGGKRKLQNDTKIDASGKTEGEKSIKNESDKKGSELMSQLKTNLNLSALTSPHIIHVVDSEATRSIPRGMIRPLVSACRHRKCAVVPINGNMGGLRLFETFFRNRQSGEIEDTNGGKKHVDTAATRQYDDLLYKPTKNNGTIFDEVSTASSDSSDDDDIDDADNRFTTTAAPETTASTTVPNVVQTTSEQTKQNEKAKIENERPQQQGINYRDLQKAVSYEPNEDFHDHVNKLYYMNSVRNSGNEIKYLSLVRPQQFTSNENEDHDQHMENKVEIVADKGSKSRNQQGKVESYAENKMVFTLPNHLTVHKLAPPHNPTPSEEEQLKLRNITMMNNFKQRVQSFISGKGLQKPGQEVSSWEPVYPAATTLEELEDHWKKDDTSLQETKDGQPETFMNAVRPGSNSSFYFTQGPKNDKELPAGGETAQVKNSMSEMSKTATDYIPNPTSNSQHENVTVSQDDLKQESKFSQNNTEVGSISAAETNQISETSINAQPQTNSNDTMVSAQENSKTETLNTYQGDKPQSQNEVAKEPEVSQQVQRFEGKDITEKVDNLTISVQSTQQHSNDQERVPGNDLEKFVNESRQPETVEKAIKALAGISQLPTPMEKAPQPLTQNIEDTTHSSAQQINKDGSETLIIAESKSNQPFPNTNKAMELSANLNNEAKAWTAQEPSRESSTSEAQSGSSPPNDQSSLPQYPTSEKVETPPFAQNALQQGNQAPKVNDESENLLPSSRLPGLSQEPLHESKFSLPLSQLNASTLAQMKKDKKEYYCRDRPCFSINDIWKMFHCDHPPCFKNFFARLRHQPANTTGDPSSHFNQTRATIKFMGNTMYGEKLLQRHNMTSGAHGNSNASMVGGKKKEYYCANRPCFSINDIWRMLQCDRPPCHKEMFTKNSTLWYKQMYENDTANVIENLVKSRNITFAKKPFVNLTKQLAQENKPLREMFSVPHYVPSRKPVRLLNMSQYLGTPSQCFCPENMLDEDCKRNCVGQLDRVDASPFASVMSTPLKQIEQHAGNAPILPAIQRLESELQRRPFLPLNFSSSRRPFLQMNLSTSKKPFLPFNMSSSRRPFLPLDVSTSGIVPSENKTISGKNDKTAICRSWTFIPQFKCLSHSGDVSGDSEEYNHQYSNCHALPYAPYVKCYGNNLNAAAEKLKMAKKHQELNAFLKATDSTRESTLKAIKAVENAGLLHVPNMDHARLKHVQGPSIGDNLDIENKMSDDVAVAMLENANKQRENPGDLTSLLTNTPNTGEKLGNNHIVLSLTKNSTVERWPNVLTSQTFEKPETRVTKPRPVPPVASAPPTKSLPTSRKSTGTEKGPKESKNSTRIEFNTYVNHLFRQDKAKENLFRKILQVMMNSPRTNATHADPRDPWEFVYPALKWVDKYETVWKPNFKGSQPRFILKKKFRRKNRNSSLPLPHRIVTGSHILHQAQKTSELKRLNSNQNQKPSTITTDINAMFLSGNSTESSNVHLPVGGHRPHTGAVTLMQALENFGANLKEKIGSDRTGNKGQSVRSEQLRYSRKPMSDGDGTKVRTVTTSIENTQKKRNLTASNPVSTLIGKGTNLVGRSQNVSVTRNKTLDLKTTEKSEEKTRGEKVVSEAKPKKPEIIETIAYPEADEEADAGSGSGFHQETVWKGDIQKETNRKLKIMWKPVHHRHVRRFHHRRRRRYRLSSKKAHVPSKKNQVLSQKEMERYIKKMDKGDLMGMALSMDSDVSNDEQQINKLGFSAPRSEDVTYEDLQPSKLD